MKPADPTTGEKAREQKEREERESRNEQLAGSSYQVPVPEDFMSSEGGEYGDYLSGVPWGGVSIQHMVAMGHESESRRGSRRGGGLSDHQHQQQQQYDYGASFYDPQLYDAQLAGSGGGYGGGADDSNRYFDALSSTTSGSSPSYLSFDSGSGYDNFSGDNSSSSGARY